MPRQGGAKHLLITTSDGPGLTHIATGGADGTVVTDHPDGRAEIEIDASAGAGGPFMQAMRAQGGGGDGHDHGPIKATVVRHDHLRLDESVQIVPPAQRDRNMGDLGVFQVARARVTKGDWSHDVLVPYAQDVVENRWDGAPVRIPGTTSNLHLQLGQTRLQMPARITLEKFELVPYPGGEARQGSMFRDFKSTLTIENPRTGEKFTALAHMNNPVYFTEPGSVPVLGNFLPFKRSWLFFQAAYDPERQAWTILGVGNRPGVWVMTAGCVMIFVGLMYAFYVKPIIIRRMKANALAKAAQAAGKVPPKKRPADQAPELAAASS
jgi:hypothetical protein